MKRQKLTNSGFTIVEALVSMAVAGIVIGSLTQVVTGYVHVSQRGRYLNLANSYVEGKVEALRNAGFNAISTGTSSLSSELPSQLPPRSSATMTVSLPQAGLKQIDISVSYQDNGQTSSYSYTTYVGELGVGQ